jgi:hypothetical protein
MINFAHMNINDIPVTILLFYILPLWGTFIAIGIKLLIERTWMMIKCPNL